MANPSLQIGNSNWAIKEDNLLGYSTAGTRFVPQPITMTRATLGTRVNPSGLVEDVALLGSELVTNGDFATDSDWTLGANTTISSGTLNFSSASSNTDQSLTTTNSKIYKVIFSISNYVSGSVRFRFTGAANVNGTSRSTDGTFTQYITATANNSIFRFAASSFSGSIDNVSVKEATIDNLARVDYTDGTSSLLVEPQRTNLLTYSEDFSDSSWLRAGSITTTDNYTTSPSGQNNATRLQWTNATNFIYQNVSHVGSDFTLSIYLKSNTGVSQNVRLFMDNGAQATNVVVTTQWQRFEFTSTSTPTQSNRNTGLIKSSSQVGNLDISIWSAQFEEGSYATSYIPTSGSTVTRNQETYTKTGISDKINSTEGVLFTEIASFADYTTYRYMGLTDGSSDNRVIILYYSSSTRIRVLLSSGGTKYFDAYYEVASILDFHKVAIKWKENDFALWIDGVERATDTSGLAPIGLNTVALDQATGSNFYGKVKQLQVYKTALTDTELATLTTI